MKCSAGFTGIDRCDLFETPGTIGAIYFTMMWSDHKIAIAIRVQLSAAPNLESKVFQKNMEVQRCYLLAVLALLPKRLTLL
jgi:hypothetical protein